MPMEPLGYRFSDSLLTAQRLGCYFLRWGDENEHSVAFRF